MGEICHVITNNRDPAWDTWDVYGEGGDHYGSEPLLRHCRGLSKDGSVHRGVHPDFDQDDLPHVIEMFTSKTDGDVEPWDRVSVYWFEKEER